VPEFTDPSGKIVIAEIPVNPAWIGRRILELEEAVRGRIAYVTRLGDGIIPSADLVYQEGDFVHVAIERDALAVAEKVLDSLPPAH
jgi:trk system potassium uptake protein TrkA